MRCRDRAPASRQCRAVLTAPQPLPEPPRLASPHPDHAIARSQADYRSPSAPITAVRPFGAVTSFVHGERRPSSPLAVLRPWSIEHTSPSLLPVAGPPPATVAPPRRKNAAAEPVFSPSPSTRSSGELFSPSPCPAGSLTVVGARPPPFPPPPPLWYHRQLHRDARMKSGDRSGVRRAAPYRRLPHGPRPARQARAARCAHGPRALCTWAELMPRAWAKCTVHLGRAWFRPSGSRFKFSIFRIYSNPCKFKNLCRIHLNSENYETNFFGEVLICARL
jgi:hypothetical protein